MRRDDARQERRERGQVLLAAWGLAILSNALGVFGLAPEGWAWTALHVVLSAAFTLALVWWLVAVVRERRLPAT